MSESPWQQLERARRNARLLRDPDYVHRSVREYGRRVVDDARADAEFAKRKAEGQVLDQAFGRMSKR